MVARCDEKSISTVSTYTINSAVAVVVVISLHVPLSKYQPMIQISHVDADALEQVLHSAYVQVVVEVGDLSVHT